MKGFISNCGVKMTKTLSSFSLQMKSLEIKNVRNSLNRASTNFSNFFRRNFKNWNQKLISNQKPIFN